MYKKFMENSRNCTKLQKTYCKNLKKDLYMYYKMFGNVSKTESKEDEYYEKIIIGSFG